MVHAALVFGDADHLATHRSFHSGDYSCLPDGLRFSRAGPAESREYLARIPAGPLFEHRSPARWDLAVLVVRQPASAHHLRSQQFWRPLPDQKR